MKRPFAPRLPVKLVRERDPGGWRGMSIMDADGRAICNMVMKLDDTEVDWARLIVRAVNGASARKPKGSHS